MNNSADDFHLLKNQFDVSRETYDRLKLYQELLLKWQTRINLISSDTVDDSWRRHFLDSLQLYTIIKDINAESVDMGTGAGFPGMALAIAGAGPMHLIESDTKKVAFLREVARMTGTPVIIHRQRIEEARIPHVKNIFSRACAPLPELFSYAFRHASDDSICYFHKGKNYPKELLDSNGEWLFDYSIYPSITDAQGVILKIANLRKRPKGGSL